ncbi:MAG TPA: RIP metalloprotease RseP [Candidatus Nanoarchaeia archaeon]|nr:RIP metalloprotease RseP [Candidatus Nanoarchaeia archaeon]
MLLTLIIFIIVLSVLVFVHELGHFWVARKMGVKVEEFGFGLPPRAIGALKFQGERMLPLEQADTIEVSENLFGEEKIHEELAEIGLVEKIKRWKFFWGERLPDPIEGFQADDTVYSINWLPLGGFCKIKGENGENETDQDSFVAKKIWQRIAIISAGVVMNIFLAMALFAAGYMIGLPQSVDDNSSQKYISGEKIQIVEVLPDTPAAKAGLRAGDVVETIDGNKFKSDAALRNYVNSRSGKILDYRISRADKIFDYKITPAVANGKGEIGIAIVNTGLVRYPWYLAIWKGISTAVILLGVIIVAFYDLIKNLILGHGLSAEISGPVGIATMTGQYARMGFVYLLQFVGLLSLNLAVVNFFPFPALDGGRIVFLLIEKIKGSPVKREVEAAIHNVGFIALILLVLAITVKDISHYTAPLVNLFHKIF